MVVSPPKKWKILDPSGTQEGAFLADELKISPLLAGLLTQRGIRTFEEAKTFFRPNLSMLHDPFSMQDMPAAVARVRAALEEGQKIRVYGDYDVDGTTSVAMMYSFLKRIDAKVDHYQPDRYEEGYGVSMISIDRAKEDGIRLMIALDCGVKALEQVAKAKNAGIDFIICDHHTPGDTLPEAVAVLDPKRSDCNYPYKGLSGCGVGFKLIQALIQDLDLDPELMQDYLDLLVVSIGADIVPMTGENRVLAHFGLKRIMDFERAGISAMFKRAAFNKTSVNITDVVFTVAPRINAAGRIGHAELAVRLLLAESEAEAHELSEQIEVSNNTRKGLDKDITAEALMMVKESCKEEDRSTVVWGEGWNKGVIGIVASRLIENYYRPTVVLSLIGDKAVGSVRSIEGIDVYKVLCDCEAYIEQFGGHTMAAGLHVKKENLEAFKTAFEAAVAQHALVQEFEEEIEIAAEIDFSDITTGFYRILRQFAPFGPENMRPVFLTRNVQDAGWTKKVGATGDHLKAHLCQETGSRIKFNGIAFKWGFLEEAFKRGKTFDIVYTLEENEWNGNKRLELNIKDLRQV